MISSVMTEEESEAWEVAERRMDRIGREGNDGIAYSTPEENEEWERLSQKQERYQDSKGEDWIDECARTFTPEEFNGAMRFSASSHASLFSSSVITLLIMPPPSLFVFPALIPGTWL